MLGRDAFLAELLRGLKSAILYQEVALKKREEGLSEVEIEQVLGKEAKKRTEAAELFARGGNQESSEKELKEKAAIEKYLPEQMSEAELEIIIDEAISSTEATGPAAMGQVIGKVKAKVGNSADGALIARIAKQKLGV
jgi:uncharacterized protein YqeY